MPRKDSRHAHRVDWRMYTRPNLGKTAETAKKAEVEYVTTFRERQFAHKRTQMIT